MRGFVIASGFSAVAWSFIVLCVVGACTRLEVAHVSASPFALKCSFVAIVSAAGVGSVWVAYLFTDRASMGAVELDFAAE